MTNKESSAIIVEDVQRFSRLPPQIKKPFLSKP